MKLTRQQIRKQARTEAWAEMQEREERYSLHMDGINRQERRQDARDKASQLVRRTFSQQAKAAPVSDTVTWQTQDGVIRVQA